MNILLILFIGFIVYLMFGNKRENMDNTSFADMVATLLKNNPNLNYPGYVDFLVMNKNESSKLVDMSSFNGLKLLGTNVTGNDVKNFM